MARSNTIFSKKRDRVTLMPNRLVAFIGLCACLVAATAVSRADAAEHVTVPFTCEVGDRGVYARPSSPQSYPIIGQREAAPFTACASDGSDRCRTLMLHRFDIDCEGERVAWPEFYSAISDATSGRAFFEGDRLLVRVRPQRARRAARSRFQPPPSRRSFLVEMPDGFAPLGGTVARFQGGRSARNAPLRATRDPFTSPPPPQERRAAPARRPAEATNKVARVQPKPAVAKPKKQPVQKPAQRNIIVVPQDKTPSTAQSTTPTVTKPTVAVAPAPNPVPPEKPAPKSKVQPSKTGPKLKVVKAPPVQPKPEPAPASQSTSEDKPKTPATAIVPKLLNGPKKTAADKATETTEPDKQAKTAKARKPDSIADLLEDRGAKLRADTNTAQPPAPAFTRSPPVAPNARVPAASPTLANTLAVLGIVAGLMFVFAYAAYRFLTPNPTPSLAFPRPTRPAKHHVKDVQPVMVPEPSLAGMAQPSATNKAEQKPDTGMSQDISVSDQALAQPASQKALTRSAIAIPKPSAPTLESPEKHTSDFGVPQRAPPSDLSAAAKTEKKEPTLSLNSSASPSDADKSLPELPMPKLVAAQIKQPDFDESALLLPKTRQEALTALGVGESAGEDVIERVVAGLRQCWRPDESNDKAERKRRLQRMQQIETAWRILSEPHNAPRQHAKHPPN